MFASGRLSVNGFTFRSYTWGPDDGRVVLLLHGFPQTALSWTGVAERLAGSGLRSVAVDQRGYSPGARPSEVSAYAMGEVVSDAAGFIDTLGVPVNLVGHDFGGVVGWQLAARRPDLVRSFTAVSTPNSLAVAEVHASDPAEKERFAYIRAFRQPGVAEQAMLDNDAAGLRAVFGGVVAPDRVEHDVTVLRAPGALTAALNWYRAMSEDDIEGLGLVTVPTSYMWGSDDIAFSRAVALASGRYVEADYEFVPLEGLSHWLPDQAPDVLAEEITRRVLGTPID